MITTLIGAECLRCSSEGIGSSGSAETGQAEGKECYEVGGDVQCESASFAPQLDLIVLQRRRKAVQPWWDKIALLQQTIAPIRTPWRTSPCRHCGATLLLDETKSFCCGKLGRHVVLPPLAPLTPSLASLLHQHPRELAANSRKLNNLFCFTTLGTTGSFLSHNDRRLPPGAPTVILNGRTYTAARPLKKSGHSLHAMLYDNAALTTSANTQDIPARFVSPILNDIRRHNAFFRVLQTAQSRIQPGSNCYVELAEQTPGGEIAALIYSANSRVTAPRSVTYTFHNDIAEAEAAKTETISSLSPLYDPLHFVLLFPNIIALQSGEIQAQNIGWSAENRLGLTLCEWTRRRLLAEPRFRLLDRLGCEYMVDICVRILESRLRYVATSKRQERAREVGFEEREDDEEEMDPAKLPASFVGSPAWTAANCGDALTIARKLGGPSAMITVTFNPRWPEVIEAQKGSNTLLDPIITTRIFRARLAKLMKAINLLFGGLDYSIHVIEFQKRGHPHAHIIVRFKTPIPFDQIDKLVSAEFPTGDNLSAADQRLRDLMLKNMQHPKDHLNDDRYSRCNKNGSCEYGFPHPIRARTTVDEHGRVLYRRRKEEYAWTAQTIPVLILIWEGHLHADIVYTSECIIYAFKYLFKGVDHASVRVIDVSEIIAPPPL